MILTRGELGFSSISQLFDQNKKSPRGFFSMVNRNTLEYCRTERTLKKNCWRIDNYKNTVQNGQFKAQPAHRTRSTGRISTHNQTTFHGGPQGRPPPTVASVRAASEKKFKNLVGTPVCGDLRQRSYLYLSKTRRFWTILGPLKVSNLELSGDV